MLAGMEVEERLWQELVGQDTAGGDPEQLYLVLAQVFGMHCVYQEHAGVVKTLRSISPRKHTPTVFIGG